MSLSPAPRDVEVLLHKVLADYHPDLIEAEVTFSLLFAHAKEDAEGNPVGPALKLHGYPALAIIKINSLQHRMEGLPDCTIRIDGDQWSTHLDEVKRAILDHEATHLALVRDSAGNFETDDANRPKMKMREHDIVVGGFKEVVDRHQKHAVEAQQFLEAHKVFLQTTFPWG